MSGNDYLQSLTDQDLMAFSSDVDYYFAEINNMKSVMIDYYKKHLESYYEKDYKTHPGYTIELKTTSSTTVTEGELVTTYNVFLKFIVKLVEFDKTIFTICSSPMPTADRALHDAFSQAVQKMIKVCNDHYTFIANVRL